MAGKRRSSQRKNLRKAMPVTKAKEVKVSKKSRVSTRQKSKDLKEIIIEKSPELLEQVEEESSRSISPSPKQKRIYISDDDDESMNNRYSPKPEHSKASKPKRIYIDDEDDIQEIVPVVPKSTKRIQDSEEDEIQEIMPTPPSRQTSNKRKQIKDYMKETQKSPSPLIQKTSRRLADKQALRKSLEKSETPKPQVVPKTKKGKNAVFKMDRRKKSAIRARNIEDEEVAAEFGVVLLKPPATTTLARIQFHHPQLQTIDECESRLKKQVKHLELNYKTKRNHEGIAYNKVAALYDGIYKAESSTKGESLLNHAVGFFKSDQFYILPIRETYDMARRISRPIEIDIIRQNQLDDAHAYQNVAPVLNPVRVRFARHETEWQRKRREQSFQYRQMLYEQDQWLDMEVKKEDVRLLYKKPINKARRKEPLPIKEKVVLPIL